MPIINVNNAETIDGFRPRFKKPFGNMIFKLVAQSERKAIIV